MMVLCLAYVIYGSTAQMHGAILMWAYFGHILGGFWISLVTQNLGLNNPLVSLFQMFHTRYCGVFLWRFNWTNFIFKVENCLFIKRCHIGLTSALLWLKGLSNSFSCNWFPLYNRILTVITRSYNITKKKRRKEYTILILSYFQIVLY